MPLTPYPGRLTKIKHFYNLGSSHFDVFRMESCVCCSCLCWKALQWRCTRFLKWINKKLCWNMNEMFQCSLHPICSLALGFCFWFWLMENFKFLMLSLLQDKITLWNWDFQLNWDKRVSSCSILFFIHSPPQSVFLFLSFTLNRIREYSLPILLHLSSFSEAAI